MLWLLLPVLVCLVAHQVVMWRTRRRALPADTTPVAHVRPEPPLYAQMNAPGMGQC